MLCIHSKFRGTTWPWLAVALLTATARSAPAQETRRFEVAIDGARAGTYHMAFQPQADGTLKIAHQANVRVTNYLVFIYSYVFTGTEQWKDGQLVQWDAVANDNGTRFKTTARREATGFRITVNGKERMVRPDFWLTTYSQKPAGQPRGQNQRVLEPDSGKESQCTLDFVGVEERIIAGQKSACAHLRLRGGVQVDVWYDAQGRLVHQESLEEGHRTALRLVAVDR